MKMRVTIQSIGEDNVVLHEKVGEAEVNLPVSTISQWFAEQYVAVKMQTVFKRKE